MKKIISAVALAAAGLGLATPAAHAAPSPDAGTTTSAQDAVAGLTAVIPDPPKSQVTTATDAFFGMVTPK
ncbi:hypothetical protein [Streptomyces arboris]|uniref:Secreted protein n=1 Tax=Streptomyces arboris TaxID=2600619 RepID=A0A5N5ECP4_9ACTN|nr:hypothetical protein [Streptomyces arboris]KAB2587683.1 hypothetical protein F5983_36615 [Streptomyces arboris]